MTTAIVDTMHSAVVARNLLVEFNVGFMFDPMVKVNVEVDNETT